MSEEARIDFTGVEPGRKGEILSAAAGVFADEGYETGSMRSIAARVGVTEPALYRHFPGKEELFIAVLHALAAGVLGEVRRVVGSVRAETLRSDLLGQVSERRRALVRVLPLLRSVLIAASRNERFLLEYRTVIIEPVREMLVDKATELDRSLGLGPQADDDRRSRVRALMSLMVGYMISSFVLGDSPDEAIVDAALRIMGWDGAGA